MSLAKHNFLGRNPSSQAHRPLEKYGVRQGTETRTNGPFNYDFYLWRPQLSTVNACTGSPSAPSRVCPWSPGACRSHCSRRSRRASRSCSPLLCWIWAGPRCSFCFDMEEAGVVGRLGRLRLRTEESERQEVDGLYRDQKCWLALSFYYRSKARTHSQRREEASKILSREDDSLGGK